MSNYRNTRLKISAINLMKSIELVPNLKFGSNCQKYVWRKSGEGLCRDLACISASGVTYKSNPKKSFICLQGTIPENYRKNIRKLA